MGAPRPRADPRLAWKEKRWRHAGPERSRAKASTSQLSTRRAVRGGNNVADWLNGWKMGTNEAYSDKDGDDERREITRFHLCTYFIHPSARDISTNHCPNPTKRILFMILVPVISLSQPHSLSLRMKSNVDE